MNTTVKLSECTLTLVEALLAMNGFEPTTENEYSSGDDVFSRSVSGQYAIMKPKGPAGGYLGRRAAIEVVEAYDTKIYELETALLAARSLADNIQGQKDFSEKVYRSNSQSYRQDIALLKSQSTPDHTLSIERGRLFAIIDSMMPEVWPGGDRKQKVDQIADAVVQLIEKPKTKSGIADIDSVWAYRDGDPNRTNILTGGDASNWTTPPLASIVRKNVLAPIEPTVAMIERGAESVCSLTEHGARGVYQAMIAEVPNLSENSADVAWAELCNLNDRTSPAEYPDHALITRDELAEFMCRAALVAVEGSPK